VKLEEFLARLAEIARRQLVVRQQPGERVAIGGMRA
jgi:hypothetical protein